MELSRVPLSITLVGLSSVSLLKRNMKVLLSILVLGFLSVQGSEFSSVDPLQTAFHACDANQDNGLTLDEIKDDGCMEILESLFGVTEDVVLEKFQEIVNEVEGQSLDRFTITSWTAQALCALTSSNTKFYSDGVCQDCNCDSANHDGTCGSTTGICNCKDGWFGNNCGISEYKYRIQKAN